MRITRIMVLGLLMVAPTFTFAQRAETLQFQFERYKAVEPGENPKDVPWNLGDTQITVTYKQLVISGDLHGKFSVDAMFKPVTGYMDTQYGKVRTTTFRIDLTETTSDPVTMEIVKFDDKGEEVAVLATLFYQEGLLILAKEYGTQ